MGMWCEISHDCSVTAGPGMAAPRVPLSFSPLYDIPTHTSRAGVLVCLLHFMVWGQHYPALYLRIRTCILCVNHPVLLLTCACALKREQVLARAPRTQVLVWRSRQLHPQAGKPLDLCLTVTNNHIKVPTLMGNKLEGQVKGVHVSTVGCSFEGDL